MGILSISHGTRQLRPLSTVSFEAHAKQGVLVTHLLSPCCETSPHDVQAELCIRISMARATCPVANALQTMKLSAQRRDGHAHVHVYMSVLTVSKPTLVCATWYA